MKWAYSDKTHWLTTNGRICGEVSKRFFFWWYAEAYYFKWCTTKSKMFITKQAAKKWMENQFVYEQWREKQ